MLCLDCKSLYTSRLILAGMVLAVIGEARAELAAAKAGP